MQKQDSLQILVFFCRMSIEKKTNPSGKVKNVFLMYLTPKNAGKSDIPVLFLSLQLNSLMVFASRHFDLFPFLY